MRKKKKVKEKSIQKEKELIIIQMKKGNIERTKNPQEVENSTVKAVPVEVKKQQKMEPVENSHGKEIMKILMMIIISKKHLIPKTKKKEDHQENQGEKKIIKKKVKITKKMKEKRKKKVNNSKKKKKEKEKSQNLKKKKN